jgi:hypothetical protein
VRREGAGLAQEAVDEGRLAMVDVRDDRDIADGAICHVTQGLTTGTDA